jgi:adenylate kinase family enzyme
VIKTKIYIFGASGSGTTTLASDLSNKLGLSYFDADTYFWLPTNPPFQEKRDSEERRLMIKEDLESNRDFILSGSMSGWGDEFVYLFDIAIYLSIPKDIRIERLSKREGMTFGEDEIKFGGRWYNHYTDFINWASSYDDGGLDIRSKALHYEWMKLFQCPVIRIVGDISRDQRVEIVLQKIEELKVAKNDVT